MRAIHKNISAECAAFAAVRTYFIFNRLILTSIIVLVLSIVVFLTVFQNKSAIFQFSLSSTLLTYIVLLIIFSGLLQFLVFRYSSMLLVGMATSVFILLLTFFLPWWVLTIPALSFYGPKGLAVFFIPFAINIPAMPYLASLILASWHLRTKAARQAISNLYGPFTLLRHPVLYVLRTFDLPPTTQLFRAISVPIGLVFLCCLITETVIFFPIFGFVVGTAPYVKILTRILPEVILFKVFGISSFGPWSVEREDIGGLLDDLLKSIMSPAILSILFLATTPLLLLARVLRSLLKRLSVETLYKRAFADPRPSVLFLRTFADDRVRVRAYPIARILRLFHKEAAFSTIDELLVSEFWHVAPIVALGNPEDRIKPFGAAREYVAHSAWNDKVNNLMVSARNVLVCYEETPSISWEVNRLKTIGALGKTLFLLTSRKAPSTETLISLSEKLGVSPGSLGLGLYPLQPVAVVPAEDDCVVVFWSIDRSEAEYQVVLRRWLGGNLLGS